MKKYILAMKLVLSEDEEAIDQAIKENQYKLYKTVWEVPENTQPQLIRAMQDMVVRDIAGLWHSYSKLERRC